MICPSCEIEMVPCGGRLTCPECGYDEPLWIRRNPLFDELEEVNRGVPEPEPRSLPVRRRAVSR